MLSKRPQKDDKLKRKPDSQASTTTTVSSLSSSSSSSKSTKRKAEEDEGSEYLRRKHNFIKSSIRTDYQPDICKDYKETGFCGFGDSCKFLHDRTDYKQSWQLDQEWSKGQYKEEDDDKYLIKEDEKEEEDDLKCKVCDGPFKDPIVTKCKHYFCIDCAEKQCNEKCFDCETPTSGIFKNASKLVKDMIEAKNKEKNKKKREEDE